MSADLRSNILRYSKLYGVHMHPTSIKLLITNINNLTTDAGVTQSSSPDELISSFFQRALHAQQTSSSQTGGLQHGTTSTNNNGSIPGVMTPEFCMKILKQIESQQMTQASMTQHFSNSSSNHGGERANSTGVLNDETFAVIQPDDVPHMQYNTPLKKWIEITPTTTTSASGEISLVKNTSDDRTVIMGRRMDTALYRMQHHPLFQLAENGGGGIVFHTVSNLEGVAADSEVYVLGIISVTQDGNLHELEDQRGKISVELKGAEVAGGFVMTGSVVFVHGNWTGSKLIAQAVGLPPSEPRATTILNLPRVTEFFGKSIPIGRYEAIRESELSPTLNTSQLFVLSNVMLDNPTSKSALQAFFATVAQNASQWPPLALVFVLCGNFSSNPVKHGDPFCVTANYSQEVHRYSQLFEELGDIVEAASKDIAKHSRFVFVPGPNDPTLGAATFPQSPIPNVFTAGARRKLLHASFTTNPCRIRLFTQDIVVFRDDSCARFRRASILPTRPSLTPYEHVIKTIFDESHMTPLSVQHTPVRWSKDYLMRVFPIPELFILCDHSESQCWECEYQQCKALNPGSFGDNNGFLIYGVQDKSHAFQKI
eukprot:PhF_6_TR36137/c0_g1_i1/m.52488/K02325/POLE2; DNA polymerase epsilon subunit 2